MNGVLDPLSYEIKGFLICFAVGICMCVSIMLLTRLFNWRVCKSKGARRPPIGLMVCDIGAGVLWAMMLFVFMMKFNGAELRVYNFVAVGCGCAAAFYVKEKILRVKGDKK